MLIFTLGVVEMFVIAYWTKTVVESRVYVSGVITIVNVLIWYYVLQTFVDDINNWYLVLSYSLGCAVGTMLSGFVSNKEKARKSRKVKQALAKLEEKSLVTE
jgi:ABC-type iron transport system FetAB permease component